MDAISAIPMVTRKPAIVSLPCTLPKEAAVDGQLQRRGVIAHTVHLPEILLKHPHDPCRLSADAPHMQKVVEKVKDVDVDSAKGVERARVRAQARIFMIVVSPECAEVS